jgi:hypothetical protein
MVRYVSTTPRQEDTMSTTLVTVTENTDGTFTLVAPGGRRLNTFRTREAAQAWAEERHPAGAVTR